MQRQVGGDASIPATVPARRRRMTGGSSQAYSVAGPEKVGLCRSHRVRMLVNSVAPARPCPRLPGVDRCCPLEHRSKGALQLRRSPRYQVMDGGRPLLGRMGRFGRDANERAPDQASRASDSMIPPCDRRRTRPPAQRSAEGCRVQPCAQPRDAPVPLLIAHRDRGLCRTAGVAASA